MFLARDFFFHWTKTRRGLVTSQTNKTGWRIGRNLRSNFRGRMWISELKNCAFAVRAGFGRDISWVCEGELFGLHLLIVAVKRFGYVHKLGSYILFFFFLVGKNIKQPSKEMYS